MTITAAVDFSRMISGEGPSIAISGMLIVFAALLLITLFISALPKILLAVGKFLPEAPERHALPDRSESLLPDDALLAAIGFVLHMELQKQAAGNKPTH
ncbi:MAG: OadG family protein [Planctomycetaceae bacterium]